MGSDPLLDFVAKGDSAVREEIEKFPDAFQRIGVLAIFLWTSIAQQLAYGIRLIGA